MIPRLENLVLDSDHDDGDDGVDRAGLQPTMVTVEWYPPARSVAFENISTQIYT